MRWLWFLAAAVCLAIVFRTHSVGLAVFCLVAALGCLVAGVLALAAARIDGRSRDASALLGPEELKRIREMEQRRRAGAAPAVASAERSPGDDADRD